MSKQRNIDLSGNNSTQQPTAQPSEMGKYSTLELQAAFDAGRALGRTEGMLSYQRHIMNQLFAAYSTGKDNKELMSILGEAALTPTDLLYAKFADEFEKRYVAQGTDENRSIEQTLDLGWELLSLLPRSELKRIKPEYIDKYLKKEE